MCVCIYIYIHMCIFIPYNWGPYNGSNMFQPLTGIFADDAQQFVQRLRVAPQHRAADTAWVGAAAAGEELVPACRATETSRWCGVDHGPREWLGWENEGLTWVNMFWTIGFWSVTVLKWGPMIRSEVIHRDWGGNGEWECPESNNCSILLNREIE